MLSSIIVVLIISCSLSAILIRLIIKYAYNHNLFDLHTKRKIHKGDIPRLGGVAFVPVAIISFIVGCFILKGKGLITVDNANPLIGLVTSIVIMYILGIADDIKGLRYRTKFLFQFIVGLVLCLTGFLLNNFHGLLGLYDLPYTFGLCVTIFLIILSINAFNFIDGIDGLSSSIAILSFAYYSILLYLNSDYTILLPVSFIGVLLPFFYFNFMGKASCHNKTFMGDTGSTVLGLVLCVLAIVINSDPQTPVLIHKNPFIIAFSPLILPCFDVVNVVLYRSIKGRNPFNADDNHFHHKLLRLGLSQHATLIVELLVFIFMTGTSIYLSNYLGVTVVLTFMLISWLAVNALITNILQKRGH